jgi:four helix bundle protein
MNHETEDNLIVSLTFQFALAIIEFVELLQENRKFIVSNQLLKAGTSIGANVQEAQNAESKQDFIHKLKIAAKETCETQYWLALCKHSKNYPSSDELITKSESIRKVLNKIIASSKRS